MSCVVNLGVGHSGMLEVSDNGATLEEATEKCLRDCEPMAKYGDEFCGLQGDSSANTMDDVVNSEFSTYRKIDIFPMHKSLQLCTCL